MLRKIILILFISVVSYNEGKSQINDGVYINAFSSNSTFKLKIKKISMNMAYFELFESNPSNEFIRENKTMGIATLDNKNLNIIYILSFGKKFNIRILSKDTIYVDSASIKFYPTFHEFGGVYKKDKFDKNYNPSFSNFYKEKYYYQYTVKEAQKIFLYDFPIVCDKQTPFVLKKECEIRMLTYLYSTKTDKEGLYYIKVYQDSIWVNGWIVEADLKKFHYLWKCQNGYKYQKP